MNKPGPMSLLICLAAAGFTVIVSLIFLPAAELLPAQVFPGKRDSGESLVRTLPGSQELMKFYGDVGVQLLGSLPNKPAADKTPVVQEWQSKLVADHGDKYGSELKNHIESNIGDNNLKFLLEVLHVDKNFIYNAYALFLGLALFGGAVAIQAMGRWGAEEKTIIPVKK